MSIFETIKKSIPLSQLKVLEETYSKSTVVITGGASFIGSHLSDCLIDLGSKVTVIDDLSSGKKENVTASPNISFVNFDLRNRAGVQELLTGADYVFHLAAIHGGRGFIESFKAEMLANLAIDNNVFSSAVAVGVKTVVHASSACAYPVDLQMSETQHNLLAEFQGSMNKSETCFADGVYGWTKLFGEYQLENQVSGSTTKGRSARIFTAYGDRENESHAAIALIAKALLKADPYPIWGNGEQTRNFTYVSDTVAGLLLLGCDQRELSFDVFNIGTSHHVKVIDFVKEIFLQIGWEPSRLDLQIDKPVGVASRASDNSKIKSIFGWEPSLKIPDGLARTIAWYENSGLVPESLEELERKLMSR